MKNRDSVLFALPIGAAVIMLVFAFFLYRQFSQFEQSFTEDAKANIAENSKLAEYVLVPLLNEGKVDEASAFCQKFSKSKIRLSLIDLKGKVLADSMADTGNMSNHLSRPEVQAALNNQPGDSMRYSASLERWMMYHAVKLKTDNGDYILRIALSTDSVSKNIASSRIMMVLALILGCWLVLPLFFFIYKNIRKPLNSLLKSMEEIAAGNLNARIDIPSDGIVRDIALSASSMAEQLKTQLFRANVDKNEKNAILNAMSEAVLLVEENGKVSRCNQTARELFGISSEQTLFQISRCGIPELPELIRKAHADGCGFEQEMTLIRNGAKITLFVKGLPINNTFYQSVLLTMTDLTNLRKLESFRSDFIANVSHEIKTPLTCIVGATEILEEGCIPEDEKKKMYCILLTQTKRLNALVRDILSLAALERKQTEPERGFAMLDADSMLSTAVSLCRERASSANVKLNIIRNDPARINGDCQLLEQAVVNLLNNALNYSGSPKIDISLTKNESAVTITVQDYGIGISPEHRERIFERFYRVNKDRSRELGGTGLGLAIVKHICQLHHGSAELESTPGKGCTFRLILPV